MKKAIINFASGYWYPAGQERLKKSLELFEPNTDFIGILDHKTINSPSHKTVPYAFKIYCLKHCFELGYDLVIYADASIYAVKSWEPIWTLIEKDGYYFEEAGHWAGTWTKDSVLKKYGLTRDDAMKIPMFSAGFTGLNRHDSKAMKFLDWWYEAATDNNSFKGAWTNENNSESSDPRCKGHRHDMSVASILAHVLGMKYGSGGQFLSYIGSGYSEPSESSIAHLRPCRV